MTSARAHHTVDIVRPQRALQWIQGGNPTALWFLQAMADWRRQGAALSRLCLSCDHEFDNSVAPPAFFCAAINIGKDGWPQQVVMVGVCGKCAAKSDDELMKVGLAGLRERWPNLFGGTPRYFREDGSGSVN
jgi:hypothetical protein